MKKEGIRAELDDRENYNPGFKFAHWELRGVPIRLELGANDFKKNEVRCCKRNTGEKSQLSQNNIQAAIKQILEDIH